MPYRYYLLLTLICLLAMISLPCSAADDIAKPPRHDFPRVGPYEVISGDFHMHTVNSDGRTMTTRERVEESYAFGYDVIAVTDHGRSVAYRVAKYVGEPLGMVIVRGFESGINRKEHLVVLNPPFDYRIRDAHNWAETAGDTRAFYQQELTEINRLGGVVIYAHPHVGYREPVLWAVNQRLIQGIEFKNGVVGDGWNTEKSHGTSWYPSAVAFAMEHDLAVFANSDVHGRRRADTSPVTLLLVTERSVDGVIDAIKQRRTAAWFNGMLWGREKLLAELIKASVVFSRSSDGTIQVENHSPVALEATILPDQKLSLFAYGKASAKIAGGSRTVSVQWDNVWTGLQTNLKTEVALKTP